MSASDTLIQRIVAFFARLFVRNKVVAAESSILIPSARPASLPADEAVALDRSMAAPAKEAIDLSGLLVSGEKRKVAITTDLQRDFAVLQRANDFIMVVTKNVHGTSRMFEMRKSVLRALNIDSVEVQIADTNDIAKLYKQAQLPNRPAQGAKEPIVYTRPEQMIEEMVVAADDAKASDIHIESRMTNAVIMFRVNGFRQAYKTLEHHEALSMGQVMYGVYADAASKDTTWNPLEVSDGALEWTTKSNRSFQLRFSSSPIHPNGGFQIVLRMLQLSAGTGVEIDRVGYSAEQLEKIITSTTSRSGLVLLCGATNSGKSTSMQAILRNVFKARGKGIKVITVEDPVEYVIPDACQIPVARRRAVAGAIEEDSAFTKALRGTLRQDPDLVMVGEIRDQKSAEVVKDLGLAGRKLMATVHTNSAIGAFTRLNQIGIDMDILTMPNFISGVIYQSLVPTLCQRCAVPWYEADKSALADTFVRRVVRAADVSLVKLRGKGCEDCKWTGIAGRTVCAEVIIPDREFLKHIAEKQVLAAEEYWLASGGMRIIEHAKFKMQQGLVSPIDVEANIENFPSAED